MACVNRDFRDGYGKTLSRRDACIDESNTVIVKIVDRWGAHVTFGLEQDCSPVVQMCIQRALDTLCGCFACQE